MFPILRLFLKSFRRMTRRLSLTLVLIIGLGATPATAQITPNGLGTQVNRDGNTFNIHGGTQAGRNLFHSFYQFGLNQGQIANFWSNPAIANILARVNGGSASYINGLIQVLGGRSNLFLMNPSGIVFGPNASLNVPAAFTATTADRILFPGGSFHAYGENNFANLAGDPIGFAFDRKDPAAIVNEANLTATSVSLVAGQVINTGKVTANQITIAAVPGENLVRLSQAGQILQSFQRFWGMGELSIHRWKGFELYPVINKKTVTFGFTGVSTPQIQLQPVHTSKDTKHRVSKA
jgi:filamentous hemagglutinin family protein